MASMRRRFLARLSLVLICLVVFTAGLLAVVWWASRPPMPDRFYAWSAPVRPDAGTLLRSELFTRGIPPGARAWRLLYATTRADGTATVASAIVLAADRPLKDPRPVVAWAHGTTGIAPGCAPSVMAKPLANVPAIEGLLQEGWVYVATDYAGLGTGGGHGYLIGDDAARSVLDAVRAARQLSGLAIDNQVVVWGHSQGGNSTLWTGMRAPAYAPDVNVLGVAALAPASDLTVLVSGSKSSSFGKITSSYLLHAYAAVYPDIRIDDYMRSGLQLVVADLARRCVGEWPTLVSILQAKLLPGDGIFSRSPVSGALGLRLAQNSPKQPIAAPVLIAQGQADDLVLPAVQDSYVAARCAAGQPIDYRTYPGLDHLSLVALNSPLGADLVAWTRDRFAGRPAVDSCRR